MTAVLDRPALRHRREGDAAVAVRRSALARWLGRYGEQLALAVLLYAVFVAVGAVLLFHYGSTAHDAVSRVDDGAEVVFSSDPHLAAVGFVWNPLPSLLEIPLILLKGTWPALLARGFAANLESAAFMTGAAVGIRGILADRGAGRTARLALPLMFALDPYIVFYGANGMSEAFFLFFLVWATRALLRYAAAPSGGSLVLAGVWLGLGYLCRYEAAPAAMGASVVVGLVAWSRTSGARAERLRTVGMELALLLTPFVVCFAGWSVLSWVIVGHPFEQFSSAYGNDGFIAADHTSIVAATGQGTPAAIPYALRQMFALEPAALVVLVVAAVAAFRHRRWQALVPFLTFGPVVGFALVAFLAGETYGWLRFYIMIIPFAVVTVAVLVPTGRLPAGLSLDEAVSAGMRRGLVALALVGLVVPALYSGTTVFADRTLAREETSEVYDVLHGDQEYKIGYERDAAVATYLDGLHVGRGQILVEARNTTTVRPVARRQDVFLDTTDVHFQRDLADPVRFGIRYILVAAPGPYFDALLKAYPTLWADGAGFGPMVASFPDSSEHFRLYKVTATSTPGAVG